MNLEILLEDGDAEQRTLGLKSPLEQHLLSTYYAWQSELYVRDLR